MHIRQFFYRHDTALKIIDFGGSGYVALRRYEADTAVILAIRHQREAGY